MYCLDTNIAIEFLKGNKLVIDRIRLISQEMEIFITHISLCELYQGIYLSDKIDKELNEIENFLGSVKVIGFDDFSCREFGRLFAYLKEKGKMTNEFDLMIASIVKVNDMVLVTRDKKHFEDLGDPTMAFELNRKFLL